MRHDQEPVKFRPMLTPNEVMELLHVSKHTLLTLEAEGLPVHRLNARVLRYDYNEVLEWFRNRCIRQTPGDGTAA